MTSLEPDLQPAETPTSPFHTYVALEESLAASVATSPATIRLAIACVASGGHLLIEDHPGLGKTTMAKALARSMGLGFTRLQCTADLLPADVVGATVLNPDGGEPVFRPGPIFTNILMADELNRASPRAQSALLEAMEEHQVSVDGASHPLPEPFFVLATQNPFDAAGTAPLPHGQRDRFLVRLSLGYPSRGQMDELLSGPDPADAVRHLTPSASLENIRALMDAVRHVDVVPPVRSYVLDVVEATKAHPNVAVGASPRAALALQQVASALAIRGHRNYVTPDDVQEAAGAVLAHRLLLRSGVEVTGDEGIQIMAEITASIPVPLGGT